MALSASYIFLFQVDQETTAQPIPHRVNSYNYRII